MLRNVSYNNKEITVEINTMVGKPYGFVERIRRKGVGSQRLLIADASQDVQALLALDNNMNFCNIELRPGGIILRFRSLLETYGLVISYHQLSVFRNGNELTLYGPKHHVKLVPAHGQKLDSRFQLKLMEAKGAQQANSLPH
jgi:hypothetical protein